MLGFRFAPRIRDLGDTKLYIPGIAADYPALKSMIGGTLNIKHLRAHWDDILRLPTHRARDIDELLPHLWTPAS